MQSVEDDISEGEIVDDNDEAEVNLKKDSIQKKCPSEKLQHRNFRKSNRQGSSEEDEASNNHKNRSDDKKMMHINKKRQLDEHGKGKTMHRFNFSRKQNFRERPESRRHNDIRRIKLPSNLKYTISKPSISYAENPRSEQPTIHSKKVIVTPKGSSIERIIQSQSKSQPEEKSSFTPSPPIKEPDLEITPQTSSKDSEKNVSKNIVNDSIPEVVESPPRSPVLQLPSSPENSLSSTLFVREKSRNVCSFLSDIESEGYLSSFSLFNELDSDENEDENIQEKEIGKTTGIEVIENSHSETQNKEVDNNSTSSESSDDEGDSSSSSEEEESTTSSEEETSDTSSNSDLTPSGFGKFSSMPPFASPFTTITKRETSTTTTIDMQVKSSIASITKPPIFTTAPCIRPIALKPGLIAPNFAVPFKIYSIRDFSSNTQLSQTVPSTPTAIITSTPAKTNQKDAKGSEREEKRSRRSRSRSPEKDVRNKKVDRKKSPETRKRNSKSPSHSARRRSTTPITPPLSRTKSSHSRYSPSRSRRVSLNTSSSRKSLPRPRSKERSRKRSISPEAVERSSRQSKKIFKESDRVSKGNDISPYRYNDSRLDSTAYSDDDSQLKKFENQDSADISHMTNDESSCYSSSFYYSQNFNYQEDYNYIPIEDQQSYYEEFYSASKNFVNNYNLVEITQQQRNRQCAESNQIAVQVGNVLEIVPNTEILPSEQNLDGLVQIDPKELKIKRKLFRERKRKLKRKRKEQLRKEIQRYFDEGINIEDSEDEDISVEPLKNAANNIKSIIKSSRCVSESEKKENRRVMFGDGFYPHESSDHEELSFQEKIIRKAIRKRTVKPHKDDISSVQLETGIKEKQHAECYEKIAPPSPPPGQPSEKSQQPQLKLIPQDLFASFSINFNPIYYFLQKYHQNGHSNVKSTNSLTVRNLNTSDPRLMSSATNCYNRFS